MYFRPFYENMKNGQIKTKQQIQMIFMIMFNFIMKNMKN